MHNRFMVFHCGLLHEFARVADAINRSPFWIDPRLKLEDNTVAQQARNLEIQFHQLINNEQGRPQESSFEITPQLILEHMRSLKRSMENQIAILNQQREKLSHRSSWTRWVMRIVLGGALLGGAYGTYKYFSAPSEEENVQPTPPKEDFWKPMTPQEVEEMHKKQIRETQEGFRKAVERAEQKERQERIKGKKNQADFWKDVKPPKVEREWRNKD